MSLAFASAPLSAVQARAEAIGYLALTYTGKRLPLQVRHSAAGHYIGTADEDNPGVPRVRRVLRSQYAADHALATGRWQQRIHPDFHFHQEPCHEPVFAPGRT